MEFAFYKIFSKENTPPNNSMDVRAKQRLSYQRYLVTFGGLGGGFAPRHLNRYALRVRD